MKLISCFLLLYCPYATQSQSLTIGDKVPGIKFTVLTNHKPILRVAEGQTTNLSAYKGKLVILDFWATWCTTCIKKFPLLDSMQQAHANKLQVILVNTTATGDTKEKIGRLFTKLAVSLGNPLQLPVVFNDTVASKLFPHRNLPHYVWLDGNLKVLAITGAEEITAANIKAAINGNIPPLPLKEDLYGFDPNKPLFVNNNGGSGASIQFRSTLSGRIPGLPSGSATNKDSSGCITRLFFSNTPLLQLIMAAYRPGLKQNRFSYSVADSNNLIRKTNARVGQNNYTYEAIFPSLTDSDAHRFMQHDLQRYFNLAAKTEIQDIPCYVLTADTCILQQFISCGGKPINDLYEPAFRKMQNRHISTLSAFLDSKLPIPVINETGFNRHLDITLPQSAANDISALQYALKPYGLTLTPACRMLSTFIIYQTK